MHKKTALDHYPKSISERIDLLYQRITQRQNLPPSLKPVLREILSSAYSQLFQWIPPNPDKPVRFFHQDNPEHLLLGCFLNQLKWAQYTFGYILEPWYTKHDPTFVFVEETGEKSDLHSYHERHWKNALFRYASGEDLDGKEYMYHILFISMLQGWILSLKNALHNQFFKEFDYKACFALIYLIASPFLYETKEGDEVFDLLLQALVRMNNNQELSVEFFKKIDPHQWEVIYERPSQI